jgi:hypothetical protein
VLGHTMDEALVQATVGRSVSHAAVGSRPVALAALAHQAEGSWWRPFTIVKRRISRERSAEGKRDGVFKLQRAALGPRRFNGLTPKRIAQRQEPVFELVAFRWWPRHAQTLVQRITCAGQPQRAFGLPTPRGQAASLSRLSVIAHRSPPSCCNWYW